MDHLELNVKDLESTRSFYSFLLTNLGFHLYQEWSNCFSYKKNDFYIVFVTAKEYLQYNRYRNGLNHVAFHGGSKNDVDLLRTKLSERNDVQLLDDELYPHAMLCILRKELIHSRLRLLPLKLNLLLEKISSKLQPNKTMTIYG